MSAERATYQHLLESLADGRPIDWAELGTQTSSGAERRRFSNLRLVARIAELHRTISIRDGGEDATEAVDDEGSIPAITAWGHLQIIKRLAVGSFGELYLAHDPQLDRDVALKLVRPGASALPAASGLISEAQTLAKVRHPNVVTVHGADVREGRAGLWMELLNGRTLETWLRDNGPQGAGEATAIGQDVCRALAAVHAAGLVHGDVKAQNVMREEGGRIVLMDFGAGQVQGTTDALAGTPLYLAPEVLAGAPATIRSDIYSLGVLLFHLLTSRYPCSAADLEGLRTAHAQGARVHLRDLRPDLTGPLVDAVERALEPDPALRFATAGSMERALAGTTSDGSRRSTGIRRAVVGALAVAALVAVVAALPRITRLVWGPRVDSIAVLPFSAPNGEEAGHLLAGLSIDVVRELQRFDIEVKRATAALSDVDSAAVVQRMGTDAILRGVASRIDGSTRVHVTIVRAGASPLWSQDYMLDNAALPSLARTIAQEMASTLRVRVRPGAPAPGHQANYRAYDAYQRGRVLWEQRTPTDLMRSLEFFKRAVALDPAYAAPWAGMADGYIALGVPAFGPLSPMEARRLAKEAALEALKLDPNLVEAHTSLAFAAYLHDWDWIAAERGFKTALTLNPQYALAHHWYADYLTAMGRSDEALEEIQRARDLEPLSLIIHRDVGWHLFFQRKYSEAVVHLRETLKLDPAYTAARTLLARALAEQGEYGEALRELELAATGQPSNALDSFVAYVQARSGNRSAAERWLSRVRQEANTGYVSPYCLGLVHVALGDRPSALDEFERGYREQDTTIVNLKADPRLDSLRQEPRYQHLLALLRFPTQ